VLRFSNDALTTEALRLPARERLKLIEEVWESLDTEAASMPVSADQLQELEQRRQHYTDDANSRIDWAELKSRIAQKRGPLP